jgi:alpha-galactosidase
MRDALLHQSRTILFSLCDWGQADVNTWGNQTGNSWRMSGDIQGKLLPAMNYTEADWI